MAQKNVEVDGLRELQKAIRATGDAELKGEMKRLNKEVGEVIAEEAKSLVPRSSGKLASTIRATGSQKFAGASAGRAGKARSLIYGKAVHFGNPKRGQADNPFLYDARDNKITEIFKMYEDFFDKIMKRVSSK